MSAPDAPPPEQRWDRLGIIHTKSVAMVPELRRATVHIARWGQVLPRIVRIKTKDRSAQKIRTELKGHAEYLVDIAASTALYPNLQALYTGACTLIHIGDVVRLRDRFEDPRSSGYSDMTANLRMSNGVIVEVQLHVQPMFVAKNFEQVLYSKRRVLETQNTPAAREVARILQDAAREIYAVARLAMEQSRVLNDTDLEKMGAITAEALEYYDAWAEQRLLG